MIGFFPSAYPDELLYSQLARYYVRSGYMAYVLVAEDLFLSRTIFPSVEFINTYTPDAQRAITRDMPMEEVIQKHTMFPCYGRFLPRERRQKAFQALVSMQGQYYDLLRIPKRMSDSDRILRYCPLCAKRDRESYGETFWHRTHHIIGLNICPVHGCYLLNTPIKMYKSNKSIPPALKSAEEVVPTSEKVTTAYEIERHLAAYMGKVFQADVDMQSDVPSGQFLFSRMANTKYRSIRGEQRHMKLLLADFLDFYKELTEKRVTELWKLQDILTSRNRNFYEICLLAFFLHIPPAELVKMQLPEKSQQQLFDEKVYRLHKEGFNYVEIAEKLHASYHIVKAIGEGRYGTYHKPPKTPLKSGVKAHDWEKIDIENLPLVQKAIQQLYGDGDSRPKKITAFAVERILNIQTGWIRHYLSKCREEIKKNQETQEQYWAREVVWAVHQIKAAGRPLIWKRIRELTNMKPKNFKASLPYIGNYADEELAEEIKHLL